MSESREPTRAGLTGLARDLIVGWALVGGLLVVAVVLINVYSIAAGALFNKPFAGDFELTQMGIGVAVFCFLPYCQLVGANVSADIFTSHAGPRTLALLSILAGLIAILFSALLIWRMSAGLSDYIEYPEITGVLSIPLWWAFLPALVSLALLLVASCLTLQAALLDLRKAG